MPTCFRLITEIRYYHEWLVNIRIRSDALSLMLRRAKISLQQVVIWLSQSAHEGL